MLKKLVKISLIVSLGALISCAKRSPEPITSDVILKSAKGDLAQIKKIKEQNDLFKQGLKVDLYTAIALAIENNKDLKVKILETSLSYKRIEDVEFDMLPSMTANAGYTGSDRYKATTSATVPSSDKAGSLGSSYSTSRDREVNEQDIGFSWNILDFGLSYIRAGQSSDRYLISRELERKAASNIKRDVVRAYWNALSANKLIKRYDPLLIKVNKALNDSQKIEELLLQKPMDALLYQKELLDIQRALQSQKQSFVNAKIELRSLMGLLPNEKITLVETDLPLNELNMKLDEMENYALVNRSELMENRYEERISIAETKAGMRSLLPGLNFNASWTSSSNDYLMNKTNFEYGSSIGANLFNVFRAPKIKKINKKATEIIQEQRLALSMAVLSQVHISNIEYQIALEERNSLLSEISVLREKFYTQNSDYADLFNPTPLSFSEVQGLLSSNEMIFKLSYSEDSEKLLAFAVTKSAAVSQKINLSSFELYNIVKELREDVDLSGINKLSNIPEFDLNLSYKLYRKLFGPFDSIMKDIDHLVVVPSGPLESLPFNLLVTEKPRLRISKSIFDKYQFAEWLPKKYSLTQLPTISSLKSLRSHKQNIIADEPFIGFGDPILEGQPGELRGLKIVDLYKGSGSDLEQIRNLPNLPETANELRIIARYLNAPLDKIYLRERAREEIIKRIDLSNSQVIAFATHGLVSGEIKGLSEPALVFTPPSELSDIDDGLLKASEIAQLKINAEIIVLSACNTAASTKLGAQGLTGLSRAFIYAGAKSLLVTNWSIDSEAASLITTEMFKAISSNQNIGRGEALRNAMLKLISHKDKKEYAHPAFWAPFSLIGEGQKLIK